MTPTLSVAVTGLAMLWLARIAWVDFKSLRIANVDVVGLSLLLILAQIVVAGPASLLWPLLAAVLLFAMGVAFWFARLMGGGDAKLLFPIGLILDWDRLLWFALALIPASLLTLLGLWIGNRPRYAGHPLAARITAIRVTKGVPYAVTLFIAVALALVSG